MTQEEIKRKADLLADTVRQGYGRMMDELIDIVRQAYISGAEANAVGDSETFAEHYGCLPEPEYTEEEVVSTTGSNSPEENDYDKYE